MYATTCGSVRYTFPDLKAVMAAASPPRSGDQLAGLAAGSMEERVAARYVLADLPLARFLEEAVVPYEADEVTRLIIDSHDRGAFTRVSAMTVGGFREWLLSDEANTAALSALSPGLTPEIAAAASKLMRNQDLIAVARKCEVISGFRNTLGLQGRLAVRIQPNHPTDDPTGIAAAILDGLLLGCGDAVIGINPAADSIESQVTLLRLLDEVRERYAIPTQSCVLAHITNTLAAIERGAPVDLVFQSIAGTEAANRSFGVDLALLRETGRRTIARALLGRQQCDVLRDGSRVRAFGGGSPRCRSANARGACLRHSARLPTSAGQFRGGVHRTGVPV